VPGNLVRLWKYRLHLLLEEVTESIGLNVLLRALVAAS
jgi:hypothetical protein